MSNILNNKVPFLHSIILKMRGKIVTNHEKFLSNRQRYQLISLPQHFSDEEMAKDWTLSKQDKEEINKYRKNYRLFISIQICSIRLYGRFLKQVNELSPRIVSYLGRQLSRFI